MAMSTPVMLHFTKGWQESLSAPIQRAAPHEAVWLGWSTNPQHHRVQVEMIQAMAPHVRIRLMVTTDRAKANTLV